MIRTNSPVDAMSMPKNPKTSRKPGAWAPGSIASWLKGLVRMAFFELFAYVKGVDVLGSTIVRELPTDSPYQAWLEKAKKEIPVYDGAGIEDVTTIPLDSWPQMGQGVTGLYLRFADFQILDGRILEIPANGSTISRRQFCEQGIYFIQGSGYTILQQEGKPEQRVSWSRGDLFSVPLNVRHQHFSNGEGPARMLVVSSFPMILNLVGSEKFISENPFVFNDRYDGRQDFFNPVEDECDLFVNTNLARDIRHTRTRSFDYRGKGNTTIRLLMAGNSTLGIHVSEMPPRAYKKAHRQSGEAFVLILSGEGYSLAWPEGAWYKKRRVDWKAGTLFSPPIYWYHQNFNAGSTPARYLAINTPTPVRNLGLRFSDQLEVDLDEIKVEWEKELEKRRP